MPQIAFPDFITEVLSVYGQARYADGTRAKMAQVLAELQALEGILTTADLTTRTMARYVASKGPDANGNTVNGLLDYIKAAVNYAIEEGYIDRPPSWKRVRPRRRKPKRNRPVDWEGRRLYALYTLFLLTGIRRNEALFARVEDLDLVERQLRIEWRESRPKTYESEASVPLPEALVHVLREWLPIVDSPWLFPGVRKRGPWTGGMAGQKALDHLKRAAAEVGIKSITWHALRHTFGSHALLYHNQPLWVVQAVMRHTDVRTTQRYLDVRKPAVLAASVRLIAYAPPAV